MRVFFFFRPAHIRLTLHLNVGTWKTWPGPSVTLQMALLVKVGHVGFLLSTRDGTMEITGVWSVALNTASGLQDTGRGPDLWMPLFLVSTSRNYKMQSHTERQWFPESWGLVSARLSVTLWRFFLTFKTLLSNWFCLLVLGQNWKGVICVIRTVKQQWLLFFYKTHSHSNPPFVVFKLFL